MTVSTTARSQQFTLDGATAAFTFTFRTIYSAPTNVKSISTTGGTDTILVYTTDYTVSVNPNGVGGTLTLVDPAGVGYGTLTVYRETTNTQTSDYDDYNQFPANTLENDLDIRTMVAQEVAETASRALTLPISASGVSAELPAPSAEKIIGWDSTGTALQNYTPNESAYITAASQADAIAGTDNTKFMTPLRTAQAITASTIYNAQLDTITLAGKVSGAALTLLANTPSGAGVMPNANLLDRAWQSYSGTSTTVGWSSTSTKEIFYKKIGKIVFVCWFINGTSDSTATTISLPFSNQVNLAVGGILFNVYDNSTQITTACRCLLSPGSSTLIFYTNMAEGVWTASGGKLIQGQIWYEAST